MKKLVKKFIDWLFEPNDYYGLTWFDVVANCVFVCGTFIGLALLINAFC